MKILFDGDTLSFTVVTSDDAVKEIDEMLARSSSYLSPSGGLTYPITTDVSDLVLNFMTGDD
ncbi:hypothetical protein [Vibrio phage vB_VmeM-Yong XC32]|nr:hypothetical protein [Vibrio phage vB_VmeM-Yong XC31]QAX96448.1 hypothetical protein [Vibrio phage vB_VmeM-Yong XC32]QAX96765.1 hypothetical protein [Vibrio phage vB_VmeM-Yong MS31]QAX97084.1 hypothetical protein [Vibrio phage vB_VmeM-Yong MS32]